MVFVVDASMTLAWHFEDEATPETDAVFARTLSEPVVVPSHWFAEVANGALVGERRQRATPGQTAHLRQQLEMLEIEVDQAEDGALLAFDRILPIASAHRLTVYDALYLELAGRRGLPLATLDRELAAAARSVGIEILGENA